jgi:hypothetical protein
MHHTATNHLSRPSGLSSKIVPTLHENCLRQSFALHWSIDRDVMTPIASPLHFGQAILPSGHFAPIIALKQTAGSAKYLTASSRVFGVSLGSICLSPLLSVVSPCNPSHRIDK